jgi:hypothetical protein
MSTARIGEVEELGPFGISSMSILASGVGGD